MKKKAVYLRKPPENLTFHELFRFIWVQGVGNVLDEHGEPKPWTDNSLESKFFELGYEVDKRSIQNWLSGNNKPNSKNLNRLARIVSNDDAGYKRLWRDALTLANFPNRKSAVSSVEPVQDLAPPPAENTHLKWIFVSIVATIGMAFLAKAFIWQVERPSAYVTNLKICDESRFSKIEKRCVTNVTHYPVGTKLIFASFNLPYASNNQFFERKWYREGQLFSSIEDYADSAWENYTWLLNDKGHDQGKYDLRVILNNEATTASFFIGEINEKHEWP